VTNTPVAEAAERLRAALAALDAGEKVKLYPADVRALLDYYDQHAEPQPQPELFSKPAPRREPADPAGASLPQLKDAARDLGTATERLEALMADRKFDQRITGVLLPLVRAMFGLLGAELDGIERDRVQIANDAYESLVAAQDDDDDEYHAAMRGRRSSDREGGTQ